MTLAEEAIMQSPQARMLAMPLSHYRTLVRTLSMQDLSILNEALRMIADNAIIVGNRREFGMARRRQAIVQNHMK